MEISHVLIHTSSRYGKTGWFEGVAVAYENEQIIRFGVELPLSDLKQLGVCKTLNAWKKVSEWADSEEGHAYILQNRERESMLSIAEKAEEEIVK